MLEGRLIALRPYTLERCHAFWRGYVADPAMWAEEYAYDREKVDVYYQSKTSDPSRRLFAICHEDTVVGEIQLKRIDFSRGCATLSVHLANDSCKNRGWGSEAIRLLVDYAFGELNLKTVYADCVHRNARSSHVLENTGFAFLYEDFPAALLRADAGNRRPMKQQEARPYKMAYRKTLRRSLDRRRVYGVVAAVGFEPTTLRV